MTPMFLQLTLIDVLTTDPIDVPTTDPIDVPTTDPIDAPTTDQIIKIPIYYQTIKINWIIILLAFIFAI